MIKLHHEKIILMKLQLNALVIIVSSQEDLCQLAVEWFQTMNGVQGIDGQGGHINFSLASAGNKTEANTVGKAAAPGRC